MVTQVAIHGPPRAPEVVAMSKESIEALAADVVAGKVVLSTDMPESALTVVFRKLATLSPEEIDEMQGQLDRGDVAALYEYLANVAGWDAGMPLFDSYLTLSMGEFDYLEECILSLVENSGGKNDGDQ